MEGHALGRDAMRARVARRGECLSPRYLGLSKEDEDKLKARAGPQRLLSLEERQRSRALFLRLEECDRGQEALEADLLSMCADADVASAWYPKIADSFNLLSDLGPAARFLTID